MVGKFGLKFGLSDLGEDRYPRLDAGVIAVADIDKLAAADDSASQVVEDDELHAQTLSVDALDQCLMNPIHDFARPIPFRNNPGHYITHWQVRDQDQRILMTIKP